MTSPAPAEHRREVLALAVPAFATLVSEPLLLMADSAIVGHLGAVPLAGLSLAASVIGVLAGLSVFLAYGTTAAVARRLGAGDRAGALEGGIDGMVLAVGLGVVITAALQLFGRPVLTLYGAPEAVVDQGWAYLQVASFGFPFLLVMLASTGVLRGMQDTRTPLYVAVGVNLVNIVLNLVLVHVLELGIRGSAYGTLLAQIVAATVLGAVVLRGARREGVRVAVRPAGIRATAQAGVWLLLRTLSLQAAVLTTSVVAAHTGARGLAAHQVVNSLWTFLAFALDSIAIAAQAVVGRHLGASDTATTRSLTSMMVRWSIGWGVVLGAVIALARGLIAPLFIPDLQVQATVAAVLLVVAALQPVAGVVFVLDGVLIGAGDARYLALAGVVATAAYVPVALLVDHLHAGVVWLWAAYAVFMLARLVTLGVRARGDAWMRLGA
ncbi:MATE family efflux transporter [Mariniluteicoccus endophyticus]